MAALLDVWQTIESSPLRDLPLTSHCRGSVQGWQGLIAVDGRVYNWMGGTDGGKPLVKQVSLEYTSTRSIFTFDVEGKVELIVTFLSPVFLNDFTRQSQQFSYISTRVKSTDGSQHSVQVYMDVSGGKVSLTLNRSPISNKSCRVRQRQPQ